MCRLLSTLSDGGKGDRLGRPTSRRANILLSQPRRLARSSVPTLPAQLQSSHRTPRMLQTQLVQLLYYFIITFAKLELIKCFTYFQHIGALFLLSRQIYPPRLNSLSEDCCDIGPNATHPPPPGSLLDSRLLPTGYVVRLLRRAPFVLTLFGSHQRYIYMHSVYRKQPKKNQKNAGLCQAATTVVIPPPRNTHTPAQH